MGNKAVLLVEDNPDSVELTLRAFRHSDPPSEVVVARDGFEALDYLFGTGVQADHVPHIVPHLILLDLKLPKMHGLDVLKRIRNDDRTRLLPVVILSTSTEAGDIIRSYSLGANSYICKPVDFDQFVDVIEQVSRYWLRLNEFPLE